MRLNGLQLNMSQQKAKFVSYISQNFLEPTPKPRNSTFKSYIEEPEANTYNENHYNLSEPEDATSVDQRVEQSASRFYDETPLQNMMPGERVLGEADSILKFVPYSDCKQGCSGMLYVTNFKLAFLTADRSSYDNTGKRNRSKILGDDDIPLTNIDSIYTVSLSGKRKKMTVDSKMPTTETLEVHCKDMRIVKYGFKFAPKDQNKKFVNTLIHHAFAKKDTLLFAYEYGRSNELKDRELICDCPMFDTIIDWEDELQRCKANKTWRVADVNMSFDMSQSLPRYFVVPTALMNNDIQKAASHFSDRRIPIWCYTHINGNSLLRMSAQDSDTDQPREVSRMLDAVKVASNQRNKPKIVKVEEKCPSCQEVQESFVKLRKICMSDTMQEFSNQDAVWNTSLENTRWLLLVSRCLAACNEVAEEVTGGKRTVVIQERTGWDLSCLVSSVSQVLLDPHYRTLAGFQGLVQKEWVRMGHPFQRYLSLVTVSEADTEQVPIFLLFLDCIWQLLIQYPAAFEFTETYLTTIWDSAYIGLFDTFLFNNDHQRYHFSRNEGKNIKQFKLPSVWKWDFQLGSEDFSFFKNPLYLITHDEELVSSLNELQVLSIQGMFCRSSRNNSFTTSLEQNRNHSQDARPERIDPLKKDLLVPNCSSLSIRLWTQCYLRWQSPAQILSGGTPTQYLQQCVMVEEIAQLHHKLKTLQLRESLFVEFRSKNDLIVSHQPNKSKISELLNSTALSSSFPFSPGPALKEKQFSFTPICSYIRNSSLDYDKYVDDDWTGTL
ncbi:myotubularin-related protein 12-like isoform X2 [Dreissena polymorpha]|uniref:myotubularin-related protein 12-like isoform X2 n=1 Tax=Dreissena polymorpha TaxID=45954 RepID=UPI002264EA11|nr:myotubularin-related protein 12-like isoform X2 [Dreissena polymorpha]